MQKLNKFDLLARNILTDIDMIRNQFKGAKLHIHSDILATQNKIRKRVLLKEVLKLFETIKFIDKANLAIRSLFEKTDFKKVSELLIMLKNGFDNKLKFIIVFKHRIEEIDKLKTAFIENLVKMALGQIENHVLLILNEFKSYLQTFPSQNQEVFSFEANESPLESVHSILLELRLFHETNIANQASASFFDIFHKFNREILSDIAKQLFFKKPSVVLLESYKNLVRILFFSYQSVFSTPNETEAVSGITKVLTKHTNLFFKRLFDVFDLHVISTAQITSILDLINSLSSVLFTETDSIFWQLQLYFKKLILNAKQQSFFQVLRKAMEEETWSPDEINEEVESHIRLLFTGNNFEVFSKFVRVDETKFSLSRSFLQLLWYFNELLRFQENIGNIGSELFTKTEEAVMLYLFNSENLILNTVATQLKVITKINTKMLGRLKSPFGAPNAFSINLHSEFVRQKRNCLGK